jgi:hypothetical protein
LAGSCRSPDGLEASGGAQPPEKRLDPDPLDRALGQLVDQHDVRRLRLGRGGRGASVPLAQRVDAP